MLCSSSALSWLSHEYFRQCVGHVNRASLTGVGGRCVNPPPLPPKKSRRSMFKNIAGKIQRKDFSYREADFRNISWRVFTNKGHFLEKNVQLTMRNLLKKNISPGKKKSETYFMVKLQTRVISSKDFRNILVPHESLQIRSIKKFSKRIYKSWIYLILS